MQARSPRGAHAPRVRGVREASGVKGWRLLAPIFGLLARNGPLRTYHIGRASPPRPALSTFPPPPHDRHERHLTRDSPTTPPHSFFSCTHDSADPGEALQNAQVDVSYIAVCITKSPRSSCALCVQLQRRQSPCWCTCRSDRLRCVHAAPAPVASHRISAESSEPRHASHLRSPPLETHATACRFTSPYAHRCRSRV